VPASPLHLLGCDLIARVYAGGESPLDFSDLHLRVVDEIEGTDLNGVVTRYGVLLVSTDTPDSLLVAIRGTRSAIEWVSDAMAFLRAAHWATGLIEDGFGTIFDSFRLGSGRTLPQACGAYGSSVVFGHSLGGPLATYVAAITGASELVCYASPKPGDAEFAAFVRSRVTTITAYDDLPDVVPTLPRTFGDPLGRFNFQPVTAVTVLNPTTTVPPVQIPPGLAGAHAITTYRALIAAA
jgi:hypothetical protein